jgi:hypothetical protein
MDAQKQEEATHSEHQAEEPWDGKVFGFQQIKPAAHLRAGPPIHGTGS